MMWLLVALLVVVFLSGAPLYAVMIGGGALGALSLGRSFAIEFDGLTLTMFGTGTGDQATVLSTIPMFIFAGYIMASAKTADRLVRFANAALGWMPGGLAIVTILASAVFTTFTGASGVTIVALGGLLLPALRSQGYSERFSLGLVAGTGSVGLLFPPALPLFVFGAIYGLNTVLAKKWEWDTERFLFAGVVPGLILVATLAVVAIVAATRSRVPRKAFAFRELVASALLAAPEVLLPFVVVAALTLGVGVAEVAALTVVYLFVLECLIYRDVPVRSLWNVSREALALSGTIFLVIFTSALFTNYLVTAEVPDALVRWTTERVTSPWVFLLALNVLLLIVGMMMDVFSAIVIVLPLIAPLADRYGINPYHLGVIFLLNLEIGYLTPPVGLNLFITSFKFDRPVIQVVRAVIPMIGAMLLALLIVTYVPATTVVPDGKRALTASALLQSTSEAVAAGTTIAALPLAYYNGQPVVAGGKPVSITSAACATLPTDGEKEACLAPFFAVAECRAAVDGTAAECEKRAIAAYVCEGPGAGDPNCSDVAEIALVHSGKPFVKNGSQVVRRLADCAGMPKGPERTDCMQLFLDVTDCRRQADAECEADAIAAWICDVFAPDAAVCEE